MPNDYPQGVDMAAAIAVGFILDRRDAVPKLIGRHEDFLFVTGLAGTARDIAALTMVFQGGNAVAVLLTQKLLGAKAF